MNLNIVYESDQALASLTNKGTALYAGILKAIYATTSLARETVIDNIKHGMNKGLGWPAFATETLKRKAMKGRSAQGLVDTGRAMTSIHEQVSPRSLQGKVYPGVNYLGYQEEGTKNIPARPVMKPVPKQINSKVLDLFNREIGGALNVV